MARLTRAQRSRISKKAWRSRKATGGKGRCHFCSQGVYSGGVVRNGKLYHKVCWSAKLVGLKPRHIGR